MKFCLSAFTLVLACVAGSLGARAEVIDTSTITCEQLTEAGHAKNSEGLSFVNGVLNWMGGYHATADQGTVVNWTKLSHAFDETFKYCADHPAVGVMSASEKFMGDNIEDPEEDGVDLAIITCETVLTDKHILENIGDTFMWLSGYHASYNNGSTMLDLTKFVQQMKSVGEYCSANPATGLITASNKFMEENEDESEQQ
jgi:hypothetical protein